ncbi:hypothetical protein MLD38_028671 [Melastoma candidum]|uniref:Uncharacterized protein n=1 Tax=Melastoma candidum TaxID=119954 RepID=A0ACB9N440_9MYRT|nr:hypothetical protein MLD38_028671 [Melastoma candidum]
MSRQDTGNPGPSTSQVARWPGGFPVHWFSKPIASMQYHTHSLYIEADFNEVRLKKGLVDNGATLNVLPLSTFNLFGLSRDELQATYVTISGFNGLMSKNISAIPNRLKVRRLAMSTAFFVIDVATTFNALLGRDWLHKAAAIPSTLHRELMFWLESEVEVIPAKSIPIPHINIVEMKLLAY